VLFSYSQVIRREKPAGLSQISAGYQASADHAAQIRILNNRATLPGYLAALGWATSGFGLAISWARPGFGSRLWFLLVPGKKYPETGGVNFV